MKADRRLVIRLWLFLMVSFLLGCLWTTIVLAQAVPKINGTERLQLQNTILKIRLAQANITNARQELVKRIAGLRTKYNLPEDKFDFDPGTLVFREKPKAEASNKPKESSGTD